MVIFRATPIFAIQYDRRPHRDREKGYPGRLSMSDDNFFDGDVRVLTDLDKI